MSKLEDFDPLIRKIARERTHPQPWLFEDTLQEARIAVWKMLDTHPDAEPWLIGVTARRAAINATAVGTMTGAPKRSIGTGHRTIERLGITSTSYEKLAEALAESGAKLPAPYTTGDFSATVVEREDVRRALQLLDPVDRELVFDRFWRELTWAELAELRGVTAGAVHCRWKRVATELRELLSVS